MEAASPVAPARPPQHMQAAARPPQHMQALEYANRVRLARAALKRSVKSGEVKAADVVRLCPWEAETMTISELLRAQRRWGRQRSRKLLLSLALSENRQLGRLTERQRLLLAHELERKNGYELEPTHSSVA
jgi:hypothetical protein